MKEDNISQLGDYDAPFCEQQYTHGSHYISLFKLKSFDQLIPPKLSQIFRHLLSCGTIVAEVGASSIKSLDILHNFLFQGAHSGTTSAATLLAENINSASLSEIEYNDSI